MCSVLIVVVLFVFWREVFWVKRYKANIDRDLSVEMAVDEQILGFIDHNMEMDLQLKNRRTNRELQISIISIDTDLKFYLEFKNGKKTLRIYDAFLGENYYDYESLELIGETDCFDPNAYCGGSEERGTPSLLFNYNGFILNDSIRKR